MVVQAHSEQQQQYFRLTLLNEHVNELLYPIRIQFVEFASQIDPQTANLKTFLFYQIFHKLLEDIQHFIKTQNCVGSAISALAAAISMLLDVPEKSIEKFIKYLYDVGQLLMDVYHQQQLTRKAFIVHPANEQGCETNFRSS
ncbi:PREDICTED: uncharacterized protein LOC105623877 [Atta cephalotes]|uniref:Uncharacterized protein n=1 Tax=Atta cephalotes TaxID=12957 RepID=A0A158NSY1_ATTCE|nr:PREDICTED: uncharacterized protein LOC105623877 [Atta cephalotes]